MSRSRGIIIVALSLLVVGFFATPGSAYTAVYGGWGVTPGSAGMWLVGMRAGITSSPTGDSDPGSQCAFFNRVVLQSNSASGHPGLIQVGYIKISPTCNVDGESTNYQDNYAEWRKPGNGQSYHLLLIGPKAQGNTATYAVAKHDAQSACNGCWGAYVSNVLETGVLALGDADDDFSQGDQGGGPNVETQAGSTTGQYNYVIFGTYLGTGSTWQVRDTPWTGTESGWTDVTSSMTHGCQNDDHHFNFVSTFNLPYWVYRPVTSGPTC